MAESVEAKSLGMAAHESSAAGGPPDHAIGGRYTVTAELGRGGMACVYHSIDSVSGRSLALKKLTPQADARRARESALLFEREFHTLTQLAHPRVIQVYDYGVHDGCPYYTMELLDGGDLRERSPMPWRQACELIYDVCSSLALLHSRRLVHRDVSPRNVRCTQSGRAKLIDFGAMVPMGAHAQPVGTPPFVAPEVVNGAALDARTDLFSVGATLYFALTGRLAYPARDFAQLIDSWSNKPPRPSSIVADVPALLDQLVASLISLEPALRPRSAFEVMQRLQTLADIQREEPLSVSQAYLVTPSLVGREHTLAAFQEYAQRAQHGRGRGLVITGSSGLGRTRMLDTCVLDAKMRGGCVLRVTAADSSSDFGVAHTFAMRLLEQAPDAALAAARAAEVFEQLFGEGTALKAFVSLGDERPKLQRALYKWFIELSKRHPLMIALDDAERADESSLALLAMLAERARSHALIVLASVEQSEGSTVPFGLEVLSGRCKQLELRPLTAAETEQLLESVFGDVPNLALLNTNVHAIAAGNPRETMALVQHLVDRGRIVYDAGNWSLPEQLSAADLPASSEAAFSERISQLGPLARRMAEAQALMLHGPFTRADYALLEPTTDARQLQHAIEELLAREIVRSDAEVYTLVHRSAAELICADLTAEERIARHSGLARLCEQSGRPVFAAARHLLLADERMRGLERLTSLLQTSKDRTDFLNDARMSANEVGRTLALALQTSESAGRPRREQFELRRWMTITSIATDDDLYWRAAPEWLLQLERDSGLSDWRALAHTPDAGQRLMAALQAAVQRTAALPEAERVYSVEEAIRLLVHYVAISIAIGARSSNPLLLLSLPALLEPFAALSPLIHAVWQNAIATCESSCYRQSERARERWEQVYERLGKVTGQDQQLIDAIRYAIAFGVGLGEATLGRQSAMRWAEILDGDALQKVNAMYLRKVVRLQQGDLEGAERCRKQAELLALQASTRQMFTNTLQLEIGVHAAAWDLTGVKQIAARIEPLADKHRGWVPFRHLAEGHYQRLRGDFEAAAQAYERCLALCAPEASGITRSITAWPMATAAYTETLIALGRAAEAKAHAERSLATFREREMTASANETVRALALAEARLGDHAAAAARLDALLELQHTMGITGLNLGASYEARARVAIWAGDRAAVERFSRLTAEQYRHGRGSPLGARYERLMDEARGAGVAVLPSLSPFESTMFGNTQLGTRTSAFATVNSAMSGAEDSADRAKRALGLLCEAGGAPAGHLFLAEQNALRVAASSALSAPDEVLQRLVSDYWSQQGEARDFETDTFSEPTTGDAAGSELWTDLQGTRYYPVLVTGSIGGGVVVNVGVALLVPNQSASMTTNMQLVSELASYLIRVGDSIAAPA